MRTRTVVEGLTRLRVPVDAELKKSDVVFYNPVMAFERDLLVAVASVLKPETYADVLAGSGARGARITKEVGALVFLNDLNPSAVSLIERNLEDNGVRGEVSRLDGNVFLNRGRRYDLVDVDPFGPPVQFVESALRAVTTNGVLAVTATDTSALCGTYPRACRRKYDASSLRTDYYDELGLRVLIGFVARSAHRHGLGVSPLFSYARRHYFRAYLRLKRGTRAVRESMEDVSFLNHCFDCLYREYVPFACVGGGCSCGREYAVAGPLWSGRFADSGFCEKVVEHCRESRLPLENDLKKLVASVGAEQLVRRPYVDVHKLFSGRHASVMPMDALSQRLGDVGLSAVRTHFSGTGLRIGGDWDDLVNAID